MSNQPFSYAHVTLISGDQGSGKSNTGTGRIVDDSIAHIHGLGKIVDGKVSKQIDALPLSASEKQKLREHNYVIPFNTVKMVLPNGKMIIGAIPRDYVIMPTINIFTNFHLYGIQYVYCPSTATILEYLDEDICENGRLTMDEYHMTGNARDSMTALGKSIEKYSFTYRKRHLDVDIMCAHEKLADWTTGLVVTERIECSNDMGKPWLIDLTIKGKGQPKKEISYDGRKYWPFYKTDERFKQSRQQIERAIAAGR